MSSEEQHEKDIIDLFKVALRHIKGAGKFLFLWQFLKCTYMQIPKPLSNIFFAIRTTLRC